MSSEDHKRTTPLEDRPGPGPHEDQSSKPTEDHVHSMKWFKTLRGAGLRVAVGGPRED